MSAKSAARVIQFPQHRQWKAAKQSALTADWPTYSRPADIDIRYGLEVLRARARELAQNSDHARGFLRIVRNNLVGKPGFVLQSRAVLANGKPDTRLREQHEAAWLAWGKRGVCEVTGKFSWRSLQRHVAETVARDGEAILRKLIGYDNAFGFALQVIDPEVLDVQFNGEFQGREVRMGVELDAMRRPVAYHLLGESPINQGGYYRAGAKRTRVPADEIIHVYLPEFSWQTRGTPWMATASQRLHMITGTEDAEVTASRASAAKFVAYEAQEWAPPPEAIEDENRQPLVDADGKPLTSDPGAYAQDFSPGTMEVVPYGYRLNMLDPQHPNSEMPDFLKWGLRSVSTGFGVSYNTLGNDAEGVNYTSLRFFLGVERDNWMELQDWLETDLPEPVHTAWADTQLRLGINLFPRPGREAQIYNIRWQPRRWEGADPAKQAISDEKDLANGTTTLTEILARKGRDFEDVLAERIRELVSVKQAAEAAGLTLGEVLPHLGAITQQNNEGPPDAEDED